MLDLAISNIANQNYIALVIADTGTIIVGFICFGIGIAFVFMNVYSEKRNARLRSEAETAGKPPEMSLEDWSIEYKHRLEGKPDDMPNKAWMKAKKALEKEKRQAATAIEKNYRLAVKAAEQAKKERAKEILRDELEHAKKILRERESGQ